MASRVQPLLEAWKLLRGIRAGDPGKGKAEAARLGFDPFFNDSGFSQCRLTKGYLLTRNSIQTDSPNNLP